MSTNITEWAAEIDPAIPGLPEPALVRAVRSAAQIFCQQTRLWTLDLARIDVVADTQNYTLTVPAAQYGQIVVVDQAKYKSDDADDDEFRNLEPVSKASEDFAGFGSWPYMEATEPTHFGCEEETPTTLSLYPIPTEDSDSGLLVRVALKPTQAALVLPDFLYNMHLETIAAGALSKLFWTKGMPWYDANEGQKNAVLFRAAMNSAKWKKFTGATNRQLRVKMRKFV